MTLFDIGVKLKLSGLHGTSVTFGLIVSSRAKRRIKTAVAGMFKISFPAAAAAGPLSAKR
jgi:hypothetical protein